MDNCTYKAGVYYEDNGATMKYERGGFKTVKAATEWLHNAFQWFMLNWATIDEYGIKIYGEVCDESPENSMGFTDIYKLTCGM